MRDTAVMMMHHQSTAQNFAFSPKKPKPRNFNMPIRFLNGKSKRNNFFRWCGVTLSQIISYSPGISPLHLQDSPDGFLSSFCGIVGTSYTRTV